MARWDLQASAGAAGRSILWRGAWGSAVSYNPYDAVYSGGSSYIAKTNNQNKDPASNPSDWDLLASVGGAGPQGDLGGLPVGTMVDYGGATEPDGWLFCFGQIIPRTGIFAPLFGAIGEAFGKGDGVTTFQLPDFRGRVSAGRDDMGGTAANRLQVTQICSTTNGSTTLTMQDHTKLTTGMFIYGPGIPAGTTISTFLTGTTLTMSTTATATASGIPIRFSLVRDPQALGAAGGNILHQLIENEMPYHSHPYYDQDQFYTWVGGAGVPGGSGYQQGYNNQSASRTTSGTGGSWSHPNTQPTCVCNRIIKYTLPGTGATLTPGTGDVTGPTISTDGELVVFNGTSGKFIRRGGMLPGGYRLPRGHLAALKTSNNPVDQVNDIDIQDGECRDSTNTVDIVLPSQMTKRLDAFWSAGTGQGGLDQIGALANLSYHVFVIKNVNTAEVDVLFSPSATAPMLPTGFTHKRRIGSFIRSAGVIDRHVQDGDYFYKNQPTIDINSLSLPVGVSLVTLPGVPKGIKGHLMMSWMVYYNSNSIGYESAVVMSGDTTGANWVYAPHADTSASWSNTGYPVMFNTVGQVRIVVRAGGSICYLSVLGWIDTRGRND
jgi:microcystin-dependent protein